ncbi:MAG: molybdate ABC transporter substrate-binding protein [Actinomycetota bacterium]|nr:molybdate ABC transporter substrate-binding protein [Actinomycetota bacterium]
MGHRHGGDHAAWKKVLPLLLGLVLVLPACSKTSDATGGSDQQRITVLAASSLTEAFGELGDEFETAHPGISVSFSFGPSDGLAQQIDQGSPADVFASASTKWMDDVEQNGPGVSGRADFAGNRLVVIVPKDDPAGIEKFTDLSKEGVKLVLAAEGVPVGDYAREALDNAGIAAQADANIVSNEEDAKAVVQKVLLGEADAGIVYVTDVTPEVAPDMRAIAIPDDVNVIATYPIAVVAGSANPDLAKEFEDLVLSSDGQSVLRSHGFLPAE